MSFAAVFLVWLATILWAGVWACAFGMLVTALRDIESNQSVHWETIGLYCALGVIISLFASTATWGAAQLIP